MFLKFWIISTIIVWLLTLSESYAISKEVKAVFTKEELKIIKKNKLPKEYAWYVYAFIYICPVFNIMPVLVMGFCYTELRQEVMRDFIKRLAKGKGATPERLDEVFSKLEV